MNKMCASLALVLSFFLVSSIATAAPNIDGVMSYTDSNDWGGPGIVTTNFASGFNENTNLTNVSVEEGFAYDGGRDYTDYINNLYYDVEELGLYINDNTLYIGIQTQFDLRKDSTENGAIASGDFIFNFDSKDTNFAQFGIDNIDPDDFAFDFTIDGDNNVDITLMAGGMTRGVDTGIYNYGKAWEIASSTQSHFFNNAGVFSSTNSGRETTNYPYPYYNDYPNGLYTLEAAIHLDQLTGDLSNLFKDFAENNTSVTMFWQPSCGNDFLAVRSNFDYDVGHAPEPATLALFGMGLLGASAWGRRQKNNAI